MEAKSRADRGGPVENGAPARELRRLRELFERSSAAMLIADDERRYIDANAAACELFETPAEQLIGSRIDDYTSPRLAGEIEAMWRRFIEEGTQAGIFELRTPGGTDRLVEYSSSANVVPGMHLSVLVEQRPDLPTAGVEDAGRHRQEKVVLTAREQQVMGLVALGASTHDIAERLVISSETAKTHVKHAMEKLGARNRAHAVAIAIRDEQIELP
jgi:PAS domain S-box-containing protein